MLRRVMIVLGAILVSLPAAAQVRPFPGTFRIEGIPRGFSQAAALASPDHHRKGRSMSAITIKDGTLS